MLPDASFAGADGANTFQQLAEVVLAEHRLSLFQPIVVQDKPLADIFIQHLRRPLTEVRGFGRVDTIADRDDGIEVVEIHIFFHLSAETPIHDCFHFGNSRIFIEFSAVVDVLQVLADGRHINPEQLCHCLLCQPDSLIPHYSLHTPLVFRKII